MRSELAALVVAGVIFGLMCVAQLVRLAVRPEFVVNGHSIPLWPSVVAAILLGGLSIWMLRLSRRVGKA